MKPQILVVSFALAAGLASLGCGGEKGPAEVAARPVVTTPVKVSDLEERISATGQLQAKDRAEIAAEVPGQVTSVVIEEGDPVEAGATVLEIDPQKRELELADARAHLAEARAALTEQERAFQRWKSLHDQNIAADSRMDEVETALALARSRHSAAEAKVGVAERALRDASVRAPFAGFVARRQVSRGEFVQMGQSLFELVALDPIEVEFHVAERDSARVAPAQGVTLTVEPYPGESFQGAVTVVSPTIDAKSRTLRVEAQLANPDGRLRPGLFARVDLGVALRKGLLMVPEEAVLQRADGEIVFRTRDGTRVERVVVTTGMHSNGLVEIASGLAASDVVVTRGQAGLIDGTVVSARNPDGTLVRTEVSAARAGEPAKDVE
jgi:membrane fusion protein (multidrug efflux system)